MTNIFDTHAHYASRQFDGDRADLLAALSRGGVVGVLECATHSGDAQKVLELAHTAPYFHAALGIHPESLIEEDAATVAVYHGDWRAELAAMRPLYEDPAVVAVGEIGLDHHWPVPREEQYALFEAQLQLARELDLPVSVHDREAHAEMYDLLRKYKPRGALHCYSGSADDAAWLVEQGMYLGFGGAVTYKGAKRAAKVLAHYAQERARTIHNRSYRQRTNADYESKFSLNINPERGAVFIVDEASMLSDNTQGGAVFGSGSLLSDLVEYVRSGRGCRLVLVGDSAQLPPVGADFSPALDPVSMDA